MGSIVFFLVGWFLGASVAFSSHPPQTSELGSTQTVDVVSLAKRQQAKDRARKIYTNDELESRRAPVAAETPAAKSEATPAQVASTGPTGKEAAAQPIPKEKDPAYWRDRIAPLQQELSRLDEEIRRWRGQATTLSPSQTRGGVNALAGSGSFNPQQTIENLERRKQAVEAQLEAIQEEARRAQVPPGWVR